MPINSQQFRISISNSHGTNLKSQSDIRPNRNMTNLVMNFLLILTTLQFTISNSLDISSISQNNAIQNGINIFLYLAIHRIKIYTENTYYYNYAKVIQVKNNKIVHSQNGNRAKSNKIKIMQYNKGGSLFKNYTNQLSRIISIEKPDILCLSESNIFLSDKDMVNFLGIQS